MAMFNNQMVSNECDGRARQTPQPPGKKDIQPLASHGQGWYPQSISELTQLVTGFPADFGIIPGWYWLICHPQINHQSTSNNHHLSDLYSFITCIPHMLMVKHAKNPRSDKPIISPLQHIHVPCAKQHIAKIYNRRRPIGRSLHSASPEAPSETVAKAS